METGRAFMNVVGGRSAPAIEGGEIPVIDPSDGQEFATLARGGSARRARARLERHAELAELECRDTGKPIHQAKTDITACARYFEFYGGAADKLHGETIPYAEGFTVFARHASSAGLTTQAFPAARDAPTVRPSICAG